MNVRQRQRRQQKRRQQKRIIIKENSMNCNQKRKINEILLKVSHFVAYYTRSKRP